MSTGFPGRAARERRRAMSAKITAVARANEVSDRHDWATRGDGYCPWLSRGSNRPPRRANLHTIRQVRQEPSVRPAAVAGMFYPADPRTLKQAVTDALNSVPDNVPAARCVVAPHAGYIYSGQIAAHSFAALKKTGIDFELIAILGPNHRVPYRGMCTPGADYMETPLGAVKTVHPEDFPTDPYVHELEHCIEVELPFVQVLFPNATVLPLVVAEPDELKVAAVIETVLHNPKAAVVISSDMSHFLPPDESVRMDVATIDAVADYKPIDGFQACGYMSWNGLTHYAQEHSLIPTLMTRDHSHSGNSVVGYTSFAYLESPSTQEGE